MQSSHIVETKDGNTQADGCSLWQPCVTYYNVSLYHRCLPFAASLVKQQPFQRNAGTLCAGTATRND